MIKTLEYILSKLVENPEKIKIEEKEENDVVYFVVKLEKEDMGKVIGKEGKVIKAIRNVMKIPTIKNGKRINISLEELE
ncbi:MAG: hypothetical protein A3H79_00170 [Candidatus Levybacteria bacterium RIFCSPLOWO2_02_FULL_36_8b]|nr:MAG: hypothetical protein A3H79_00170 [Candidatus Levybacteria bacterium RIFCSPLOWO2_02_FULL_36_8b]